MKLKKIASLMLAGVMAVSMLAGCSTTSNNNNNQTPDPEAPATGVSADIETLVKASLDDEYPEFVSFKNDTKLDDALDYAMEWAGVEGILNNYVYTNTIDDLGSDDVVYAQVMDQVEATDGVWISNIGSINVKTDGDGAKAVRVYAVSGSIGERAIKQQVANDIDELIAAYKHYDADGDNWYYDYTVSVSIDSKTVHSSTIADGTYIGDTNLGDLAMGSISSAADPVATFVAVQVVREARTQD